MTVKELYDRLDEYIPEYLREEWDNDGIMCSADTTAEVKRVLVALDATESVIDYAIEGDFDLIITHHPLIFKPLASVTDDGHIARKIIKLIESGISVLSFHTRADKVEGGVNDILADLVGVFDTHQFGEGGIGRIGEIEEEMSLEDFAGTVKLSLGADSVRFADAYIPVKRVALVGGDGKDFVKDAALHGADTYLSGRISYNLMEEAMEMGVNLIEAGHFYTEHPVCSYFAELVTKIDAGIFTEIANSNLIRVV